jgi:hypothetical protein
MPTAVNFIVRPYADDWAYPANVTLADIVRTNQFKRPIAFAITAGETSQGWLGAFTRLDGLYQRVMPVAHPSIQIDTLRANLLHGEYRGWADPSVALEDVNRNMAYAYYGAAIELLRAERARGDVADCLADGKAMLALIPPERVGLEEQGRTLRSACQG